MDALGLLNVRVRGIHQDDDTVLYIAALNRPLANDGSGSSLIFPTFDGHLQKGILALNEVFYGTQRLQAV
jgi:hypothetical protein